MAMFDAFNVANTAISTSSLLYEANGHMYQANNLGAFKKKLTKNEMRVNLLRLCTHRIF